jgi:cold shock CspA family protein
MSFVGFVKAINSGSGTGFIECEETYAKFGRDVFLHKNLIGPQYFAALRKNEVVIFTCQLDKSRGDKKGMPQAASVRNDRIEDAERELRLDALAFEDYTPPYPPDLTKGVRQSEEERQAQLIASMKPQIQILPDGTVCYIVPQEKPEMALPEARHYNPNLMAYRRKNGDGDDDLRETGPGRSNDLHRKRDASGVNVMFDAKVTKYRKDFTPNPGLDPSNRSYRGIVTVPPDDETGFGFISSCDSVSIFNRDVFIHRKECPWVHFMELEKNDPVIFQVKSDNTNGGRPFVIRIIKVDIVNPQQRWLE